MRIIKRVSWIALILMALVGPASYFATKYAHGDVSNGTLFVVAWTTAVAGIVVGSSIIGSAQEWKEFGSKKITGALFMVFGTCAAVFAVVAGVICLIGGIIGGLSGYVMACIAVAPLAGLSVAFFAQLFANYDDDWIGEALQDNVRKFKRAS